MTKRILHKVLESGSRKYFARAYPGFSKAVTTLSGGLYLEKTMIINQALSQPVECISKLPSDGPLVVHVPIHQEGRFLIGYKGRKDFQIQI